MTPISPPALEAFKRIDALSDIERETNDEPAERRRAARRERNAPRVVELVEPWMRTERTRLSRHAPVAKAMDYRLQRWKGFTRVHELLRWNWKAARNQNLAA